MKNKKILGIDFGTSTAMVAFMASPDGPVQFPHLPADIAHGMPTLFMYDRNGCEFVGDQVIDINGLVEDPQSVCQSVKMKLGKENIQLNGRSFTPRYMAVQEVKRLLELCRQCFAQNFVDMAYDVVSVAVPDAFNAAARGEIRAIIQEATGCQDVRVGDEASMAQLASLHARNFAGKPSRGVLALDCGAGTTDACYLSPSNGKEPYETHHPKGIRVAGDAVDAALAALVMDKLRKEPGTLNLELLKDHTCFAYRRLCTQCTRAKEHLSRAESYTLEVSDFNGGYSRIRITRAEFEAAIRLLLKQMVDLGEEVLNLCNLGPRPDIDILLVGGTTNIPLLQQMMRQRFSWVREECFKPYLPDKAVAMGAALYAAQDFGGSGKELITKTPFGYAIKVLTDNKTKTRLQVVIPPGAALPCKVESRFATSVDDYASATLHVYEVRSGYTDQILELDQGKATDYLLEHEFPRPVAEDTLIKLTAELSRDGILTLTSRDEVPGGKKCSKSFTLANMEGPVADSDEISDEQLRRMIDDMLRSA